MKLYKYFHRNLKVELDVGIPKVHHYGIVGKYNVLVMDLLGDSLEDLFQFCRKRFDLKTVLMVGSQMLTRIEYVHMQRYIHRDIKPDNFLMGTGKKKAKVYMIDFGLAKKYVSSEGKHAVYREGKELTGTARYASQNSHLGIEQSRRDDLAGLMYVLLYFMRGSLPW